jgi:hypothetical protein
MGLAWYVWAFIAAFIGIPAVLSGMTFLFAWWGMWIDYADDLRIRFKFWRINRRNK